MDTSRPTDRSRRLRLWSGLVLLLLIAGAVIVLRPRGLEPTPLDPERGAAAGQVLGREQAGATLPELTTTSEQPSFQMQELPTTTGTTLPLPDPPPSDPYAPTPKVPIATLSIPKLNVKVTMYSGITLTAIDRGSGHWPGTPLPGELGNMVVAGHRTLYQKPFANLDRLVKGDQVVFDTVDGKRWVYEVRGTIIVPANNIGLASQFDSHTATLFACHPKGQATQRIVAKLRLLGPDGKPVDADDRLPPMEVGNRSTDNTLIVRKYDNGNGGGGGGGGGGDPLAGAGQ